MHPVRCIGQRALCDLYGEPRLANTTDAGQRHQTVRIQQPANVGYLILTADESRELRGYVVAPSGPADLGNFVPEDLLLQLLKLLS